MRAIEIGMKGGCVIVVEMDDETLDTLQHNWESLWSDTPFSYNCLEGWEHAPSVLQIRDHSEINYIKVTYYRELN